VISVSDLIVLLSSTSGRLRKLVFFSHMPISSSGIIMIYLSLVVSLTAAHAAAKRS